MTAGPNAIARVGMERVMIPAAAPGDVLAIEIRAHKRDYALASIVRVVRPSAERRQPPCPYAARCGGCDWQHLRYGGQTRFKAEMLAAEFRRGLGVKLDPNQLVEPAPAEFGYRSRVRLKVGSGGQIGFHRAGTNSLVAVEACLVAAPPFAAAAQLARALAHRCVEIEVVEAARGEVLISNLVKGPGPLERRIAVQMIEKGTSGVILRGDNLREVFGDVRIECAAEPDCVIEADADLFSQVNRPQNLKLVAKVMQLAKISPATHVLDLFCGSGNFSLPAARRTTHVIGVDRDGLAIDAARANAQRMQLSGTQFIAMHAAEGLRFLLRTGYCPDVVIMDPPRAGAADLIEPAVLLKPRRMIYVSCNPTTLIRDLQQLDLHGYKVEEVNAWDFFPNTHHIETVTSLLLT